MSRLTLPLAVLVAALLAGAAEPQSAKGLAADVIEHGITVSGTATVTTTPDQADFFFGVRKQGATAAGTLAATNAAAEQLVAAIKSAGVAAADIRTQQVSLAPRFAKGRLAGYEGANAVSVRIRDLSRIAAVLDGAVGAGATEVDGPGFSRSDAGSIYRKALGTAIADARAKAQTIAAAVGVLVGPALQVKEGSDTGTVPAPAAAPSSGPSVEPGTQEIDATVTVTYAVA
jgi:uncharacterized protein YggE